MKRLLPLLLPLLFTSCATLLNGNYRPMVVHTAKPSKITYDGGTVSCPAQALITLKRSPEPAEITVTSDSISTKYSFAARNSLAYYANIVTNYGIGMLIERGNPKRYSYPRKVYIDSLGNLSFHPRHDLQEKRAGNLDLFVSLPYASSFLLHPEGENSKSSFGFLGFATGLDYYTSKKNFLNLTAGAVLDFSLPFPAPIDYGGTYETMHSVYFTLSNNHVVDRFSLGYGLSYNVNTWNRLHGMDVDETTALPEVTKRQASMGLHFSTYYRSRKSFRIGLVYRPSLIGPNGYEHVVSLDLGWTVRLYTVRK